MITIYQLWEGVGSLQNTTKITWGGGEGGWGLQNIWIVPKSRYILPCKSWDQFRYILDVCSVQWYILTIQYKHVGCCVQFSIRLEKKTFFFKLWNFGNTDLAEKECKIQKNLNRNKTAYINYLNQMPFFFFFLTDATLYYHAIDIVFTFFESFTGYEDDILEVSSHFHVQESKFGGKIDKFGGKSFKKVNSTEFIKFVFSKSVSNE